MPAARARALVSNTCLRGQDARASQPPRGETAVWNASARLAATRSTRPSRTKDLIFRHYRRGRPCSMCRRRRRRRHLPPPSSPRRFAGSVRISLPTVRRAGRVNRRAQPCRGVHVAADGLRLGAARPPARQKIVGARPARVKLLYFRPIAKPCEHRTLPSRRRAKNSRTIASPMSCEFFDGNSTLARRCFRLRAAAPKHETIPGLTTRRGRS